MDVNVRCQTLCKNIELTKDQSAQLGKRIRNNYYVHLYDKNLRNFNSIICIYLVWSIIFHAQLNSRMSKLTKLCMNMVIV